MEKFTHGIIAIDRKNPNDDGTIPVLHFVGYWSEPAENDIYGLYNELKTDEELGLVDRIDELDLVPASQDVLDHFNNLNYEDHESED